MFKENGVEIPANIAGLMLSAIVSDTLLFKSPTCTEQDVEAGRKLAEIAAVDAADYGLAMLKAGADLSDKSLEDLLSLDAKGFEFGTYKATVAQVNAVDIEDVLGRQAELEALLTKNVEENDLDLFFFVVTDILNNDSTAVAVGNSGRSFCKSFRR